MNIVFAITSIPFFIFLPNQKIIKYIDIFQFSKFNHVCTNGFVLFLHILNAVIQIHLVLQDGNINFSKLDKVRKPCSKRHFVFCLERIDTFSGKSGDVLKHKKWDDNPCILIFTRKSPGRLFICSSFMVPIFLILSSQKLSMEVK